MGCSCSKCKLPCRRRKRDTRGASNIYECEDAVPSHSRLRSQPPDEFFLPMLSMRAVSPSLPQDGSLRSDRGRLGSAPGGSLDHDGDWLRPSPEPVYMNVNLNEVYEGTVGIGRRGGSIDGDDIRLHIPPNSLREVEDIRIRLQHSSRYSKMIQNSGLDDILSLFRLIECKPDHLQFLRPVHVEVFYTSVPQSDAFLLFGQETSAVEGTWKDLSNECSLAYSYPYVSFKLQHFSIYILVAIASSLALSSASKLLIDCLNGKSFPCSFTPYLQKISGKKHPLTIVCKEGYNTSTSTPRMYQRFGLARTSEFNIFDEERLSVEIKHVSLVKKCADSYQINRATCKTEAGQAMDLIVEPAKDETLLTGQAVISVWRFLGARVRKICTLNLTPQSLSPEHHETGEIVRVSAVETMASVSLCKDDEKQFTAPDDHHSRKGVRKYFFFIKEKVSSDWKDLAFFLDLDAAGIRNIAGRNSDDKSRCMDMLEGWQTRYGVAATIEVLTECLSKAGLQDVVDGLKFEFPEVAEMEEAKRMIRTHSLSESKD